MPFTIKSFRFLNQFSIVNELIASTKSSKKSIQVAYVNRITTLIRTLNINPVSSHNVFVILIIMRMHDSKRCRVNWIIHSICNQHRLHQNFTFALILVAIWAYDTHIFWLEHKSQMLRLRNNVLDRRSKSRALRNSALTVNTCQSLNIAIMISHFTSYRFEVRVIPTCMAKIRIAGFCLNYRQRRVTQHHGRVNYWHIFYTHRRLTE